MAENDVVAEPVVEDVVVEGEDVVDETVVAAEETEVVAE